MADLINTRDLGDAGGTVVLCATQRLARNLRLAHDRAQAAHAARWRPLEALTLPQWLDGLTDAALLAGELPAREVPARVLTPAQERMLWERVIETDAGDAAEALFLDREGLAATAAEANALIEGWRLGVAGDCGEDARRFLRWRAEFRRRCDAAGWREAARMQAWQIGAVAGGAGRLPARVLFAGFDRYTPQERRLADALAARGCEVAALELAGDEAASAVAVALADAAAECRAAAAWAAAQLAADPTRRLGIVVPQLAKLRARLAAALDEALHPQALAASHAEMPRLYNFSLGTPLAAQPAVGVALALLRLVAGARRIEQGAVGALLCAPYWSADESEADARARLDARMREELAATFSYERLLRFVRRHAAAGVAAPRLLDSLTQLRAEAAALPATQLPSQWAAAVSKLLTAAGWPGERGLSSHEFQARLAFGEVVEGLGQFDAVLGRVGLREAVARLAQLCRERVFQPETDNDPPVQVLGPLEAAGARFDALWVMNMNDDVWPAAPSPNPLLPAETQRRAGAPGASAEIEAAFARAIHARLLRSASALTFSWARGEGERERRPSPLIAGVPPGAVPAEAPTSAERCCAAPLELLDDHRAPPLAPDEHVGGGTGLLQAQAICPAWAFYRYRLGARALGAPAEGLDASARGRLVHRMLEAFWRDRGSVDLAAMSTAARTAALGVAVDAALAACDAERDEPLPARLAALERERLLALGAAWLEIEAARPVAFRVAACEQQHEIDLAGLKIAVTVDRIDELEDGGRVVLDYKTGRAPDCAAWAAARIAEPQLPLYAAYVAGETRVEAVAFARVRAGDEGFAGIAAESALLPDVPGLADRNGRRRFADADFPDWQSVLAHWHRALAEVAGEIRAGVAAVVFEDEGALKYCEVRPLLRLAERRGQQEAEAA